MIRVGLIGIGNCAKSLVEAVAYYQSTERYDELAFPDIGGYKPSDIRFVLGIDVDDRKVGQPLAKAIKQEPNNAWTIFDDCSKVCEDTKVIQGPVLDGVAKHMLEHKKKNETFVVTTTTDTISQEDLINKLKESKVDILINFLPVGSQEATEFYMETALKAGVNVVNCIPVFIASNEEWQKKFREAKLCIIGDDMKSQFGASIVSGVIQELLISRGIKVQMHYQDNIGGNTDFLNMQDKSRLSSKKISKENVIHNQNKLAGIEMEQYSVHAGPAHYFPALGDNKRAHWLIKGTGIGGAPIEMTIELSVQDSPNSAGVVIDAVRFCKVAYELGLFGPLIGPSAWTQKTPPIDLKPADAKRECDLLAKRQLKSN